MKHFTVHLYVGVEYSIEDDIYDTVAINVSYILPDQSSQGRFAGVSQF